MRVSSFALVFAACLLISTVSATLNAEALLDIQRMGDESMRFFLDREAEMKNSSGLLQSAGPLGAAYGTDVSTLVSVDQWKCLLQNGFGSFAIPRGFKSVGDHDANGAQNIKNARAAGIKYVDYYIFPCPKCYATGAQQVQNSVQHMRNAGANFGMVWLDIEGSQYWRGNYADNKAFFQSMLQGAAATGAKFGIYSSAYMWSSIFGNGYTLGGNLPLWYAHYDNSPSFSDFKAFGGWSRPAIKQYSDKAGLCGVGYDRNYY